MLLCSSQRLVRKSHGSNVTGIGMAKNGQAEDNLDGSPVPKRRSIWPFGLSTSILIGLVMGIGCGLFFGEYCARLSVIGDVFIGLLRMTVLPYIMVSIIGNLGRLSLRESPPGGSRRPGHVVALGDRPVNGFSLAVLFPGVEGWLLLQHGDYGAIS